MLTEAFESESLIYLMEEEITRIRATDRDFSGGHFQFDGNGWNYRLFLNSYEMAGKLFSPEFIKEAQKSYHGLDLHSKYALVWCQGENRNGSIKNNLDTILMYRKMCLANRP